MTEENGNRGFRTMTISIIPEDWERIERMARAEGRSTSAQIRFLVMPKVEEWEKKSTSQEIEQ